MRTRTMLLLLGAATAALLAVTVTTGVLRAQVPPGQPGSGPSRAITHEDMHRMMDAMHGAGFSERVHQAMPGTEEMMDRCVALMNAMPMPRMMGGGSMPNMMDRMMGR